MKERCHDCFPKFVDPKTGHTSMHPFAKVAEGLFAKFTEEEAIALHKVNCLGSKDPGDLLLVQKTLADVEAGIMAWKASS